MATANSTIQVGQRFIRWLVISEPFKNGRQPSVMCRCDCGVERPIRIARLLAGKTRSCGCLRNEELTTHGHTATAVRKQSHEYWIWNAMLQRTTNPKNKQYPEYGGRGIDVCDRWRTFQNFYEDMGPRPSKLHSLERKENDKGYSPGNCKWATRTEQNQNKRSNRNITANGKTMCLQDWARELGCSHATIISRLNRGWSEERAVTTPPLEQYRKQYL